MVRNRSGPITSTTWPMARNSPATVASVRTTPFTCGCHASVTIRMRWEGANGSTGGASTGNGTSNRKRHPDLARREEGQAVAGRPVDQFEPSVVVLHQRGAAFDPVAVVDIQHAAHLAHLGMVDVAAHDAVEAAPSRLGGERGFEA